MMEGKRVKLPEINNKGNRADRQSKIENGGATWTGFWRVVMGGSVNDYGGERGGNGGVLSAVCLTCHFCVIAAAGNVWLGNWKVRVTCRRCSRRG